MEKLSRLENGLESNVPQNRDIFNRIKNFYFEPKRPEKWNNGRIYEWIGIKYFKEFVTKLKEKASSGKKQSNYFLLDKGIEGLKSFENKTRVNEAIHSPVTILMAYSTINNLIEGDYVWATILGILGVINGYEVFLQRYNRVRIRNILDKTKDFSYYSDSLY